MKHSLRLSTITSIAVLITLLVAAVPAHADTTATSTITQVQILETSDKEYELYHGVLWLDYDKSQHNYRWGGKHCGGDGISEVNLTLLFAAFRSRYKVTLRYKNKLFEGATYRCVTGFVVARS